ncbi:hypothetical protein O3S81_20225 [Agrobacterium sp. SOY23]|uniref:hypothetical protein n=1 Tax=Agrobacterium sp. SOY23 TaxID=3014555 RepID=UPI0022AF7C74|nr:hypothetical protein [Agrobacterium sp. SOY23]MCZ4432040.1 hypothetical protein [Agrobacterium sp. SOY23]
MSQIDRLNPYLHGPVTIRAPKMTLLARDFEPPLAEGEGVFELVSEREFRYRMTGLPVDLNHSLQALNRERDEPYDPLNRFRLVMTDADGTEWMGGWTVPDVDPDGDQWVLQGTVQSLSAGVQGPAMGEGGAEARFLIPRNHSASIIFRRFVQSDDGKGGLQAIRTIEALGVLVRFAFDSETNVLSISADSSAALPAHNAENWFGEPLRILFGQLVFPRLVERRFPDGRSMLWVRQSPVWTADSTWTALWNGDDRLTNDADFFDLYAGLLTLVAREGGWESHTITTFYEEVIQSAQGSRWVMALTLASSIEGVARRLVPGGTLRTDADQAAIDSLVAHIEQWEGASRLRDAAKAAVNRADAVSVQRALYTLADERVGTRPQVASWIKIRNGVMHGKLVSPYSSEEDDQIIINLAGLLRALTREAARRALI